MVDPAWLEAHRARGLTPDAPVLRGTAQNPDVFFQAREAANRFHDAVPGAIRDAFARLEGLTGRSYGLVEYAGAPDAERVVVLMGSGSGPAQEAVEALTARGEKVGVVTVRLYRPFPAADLLDVLPPTVRGIAVLDRTKEPGAGGEPLYLDVVAALAEAVAAGERDTMPRVVGGRYGLSSKEFTPAMVAAVLARAGEAADAERATSSRALHGFTVGIADDVTHRSLPVQADLLADDLARLDPARTAVFFGLGSDGTVSANKAAVKIFGEHTDLFVQGYFVYDSKKSGAVTVSHLRLAERPIRSSYLIEQADFVACHQFSLLERMDVLAVARPGATVLLNSPYGPEEVWDRIPREVQEEILAKGLRVFAIDALAVAAQAGLRQRINSVMMPAFFALSGVLPQDEALAHIRSYFEKTYGRRGRAVVERNLAAIDHALAALHEVVIPAEATATHRRRPAVPDDAPDFVQRVTARIIAGEGDLLPVSAFPVDGTFPTGTAQYEKRTLATEIPIWDPDLCIDCNKCAMVCPHTAIRAKVAEPGAFELLPSELPHKAFKARELPGLELVIQVAPDDCTGCGICVDVCPARSKSESRRKAINLEPIEDHLEVERERFDSFLLLPEAPRADVPHGTVKGSQLLQPLFEFSGACSGCGETPYLKLLSQLFGDRAVIANATGCSSIYGGNLPTTPWTVNADGRGPAWSNSLFEDNAEFGLGIRLALDQARTLGLGLLTELAPALGADRLIAEINDGVHDRDDAGIAAQRARVADLKARLAGLSVDPAQQARVAAAVGCRRRPRPPQRLDRRGRRLGVRHRLLRPRPRDGVRPRHQHPGARHRGLLQHRRPGVQGDAARRRGEVRDGRQAHPEEGPRGDRDGVRLGLRRAGGPGRQRRPDAARPAGGRGAPRAVAGDRLLDLHRPRHRDVDLDEPPEGGGRQRVLAAVPLPARRGRARAPVPAGLQGADHPVPRVRQVRGPLLDAGALAAAGRRGA